MPQRVQVAFWLKKDAKWLASLPAPLPDPAKIIADAETHTKSNREQFALLFKSWLAQHPRKKSRHATKNYHPSLGKELI